MSDKERIRFELRLTAKQRQALEKLAKKRNQTMSELVAGWIEGVSKREKVW